MNKIEITQMVANLTVAAVTRKFVRETAESRTNAPDIAIEVGSGVAGAVAADKLKPTTDRLVVKAFAWVSSKTSPK